MNTKGTKPMFKNQSSGRLRDLAKFLETRPEYSAVVVIAAPSFVTFDTRLSANPHRTVELLMGDLGGEWDRHQVIIDNIPGDVRFTATGRPGPMGYSLVDIQAHAFIEAVAA